MTHFGAIEMCSSLSFFVFAFFFGVCVLRCTKRCGCKILKQRIGLLRNKHSNRSDINEVKCVHMAHVTWVNIP